MGRAETNKNKGRGNRALTSKNQSLEKNNVLPVPHADLTNINVVEIANELSRIINKKTPKGFIRKFFQNIRLGQDIERLNGIENYINRVIQINENITQMQYRLHVQPHVLEALIEKHYADAERLIELDIAEHNNKISALEHGIKLRDVELETIKAQNEEIRMKVRLGNAEAEQREVRANLMSMFLENFDIKQMPDELQAFIIQSVFNPDSSIQDLEMMKQLRELTKADVRIKRSDATIAEQKAEKVKNDFEELRNKPKGK